MTITPYLVKEETDAYGRHKIYLDIKFQGQRFREYTGERVKAKDWNEAKKQVKGSERMYVQINEVISETIQKIQVVWYELRRQSSVVDKEVFKAEVKKARFPERSKPVEVQVTLLEFISKFQKDYAGQYSPSYIRGFDTLKEHIEQFEPKLRPSDMSLEQINQLISHMHQEHDLSDNTISMYIARLRRALDYALICGHAVPPSSKLSSSKLFESDRIFLTEDELQRLSDYNFTEEKHRLTAGRFLLACYTGFRISDLRRIAGSLVEWENFQTFEMRQKKTHNPVRVALNDYASEIWNRYDGRLMDGFASMVHQEYNLLIKEVAQLAGINAPTKTTQSRKGELIEEVRPKFEVLSSHSARHTFAVQSILKGMDIFTLRDILGHKTVTSTEKYAKIVESLKHEKMLYHWKKPKTGDKIGDKQSV